MYHAALIVCAEIQQAKSQLPLRGVAAGTDGGAVGDDILRSKL